MNLSKSSIEKLEQCDERLQELFQKVSETYSIQVIEGFRDKARQDEAFAKGFSKLQFPDSKHNSYPSLACDVVPLVNGKIEWNNKEQFYHFIGYVMGVAETLGLRIRSGADWNMNHVVKDQTFFDLPHFEIKE